jgi:hypothetical protein
MQPGAELSGDLNKAQEAVGFPTALGLVQMVLQPARTSRCHRPELTFFLVNPALIDYLVAGGHIRLLMKQIWPSPFTT